MSEQQLNEIADKADMIIATMHPRTCKRLKID